MDTENLEQMKQPMNEEKKDETSVPFVAPSMPKMVKPVFGRKVKQSKPTSKKKEVKRLKGYGNASDGMTQHERVLSLRVKRMGLTMEQYKALCPYYND